MSTIYPMNGYPPQQGGYFPQNAPPGGYPQQGHGGYMPPQADYAMQQGYPPGYGAPMQAYGTPPMASPAYGGMPPAQPGYNNGQVPPGYAAYQQQPPPGYGYPSNGTMGGYPPTDPMKPPIGAPGYNQQYAHTVVAIPVAAPPENPRNVIEKGRWSAGICDCCSSCVPNLFMTWCCPCVSLAQIQARIGMASYRVALTRLLGLTLAAFIVRFVFSRFAGSSETGSWITVVDADGYYSYQYVANQQNIVMVAVGYSVWLLIQLVLTASVCVTRQRVRQRFRIPGGCCEDVCCACCCSCCAIAQMATHVKSYTPGSCDFGGPDVLPAFN